MFYCQHMAIITEWLPFLIWSWVVYRCFISSKPKPLILRFIRFILIPCTCGLLAGCSNPDPLAVASGPVFALNAGHWQPSPHDLERPPISTNQ